MIVEAQGEERIAQVRELFAEYWESFGFTPCFRNFADELAQLPSSYVPPGGRLAIALRNGSVAGCIALRPIDSDSCE